MQNCKLALPEAARQLFEQVVTGAEYIIERADADVLRAASDEPVGERRRPCRAANERQGAAVADAERRELHDHADKLELLVDDREWYLPKYREMLFLR